VHLFLIKYNATSFGPKKATRGSIGKHGERSLFGTYSFLSQFQY
jgi:hypothetical protein